MASPAPTPPKNPADRAMANAYPVGDIDPSTATDLELLRVLRQKYQLFKKQRGLHPPAPVASFGLAGQKPSDLPPCFLTTRLKMDEQSKNTRWGGDRLLREVDFTAIRDRGLRYVGAKKTHEFRRCDGTMTEWRLDEYYLIDGHKQDLYLGEEMVLCRVSKRTRLIVDNKTRLGVMISCLGLAQVLGCYPVEERPLNLDKEKKERCKDRLSDLLHKRRVERSADDQASSRERKTSRPPNGKSEVWQHFTKIHTEDPDVVYAACHCCDRMLKAHPKKDGTNHLRRHNDICRCKQRQLQEENKHNLLEEMEEQKLRSCGFDTDIGRLDPWEIPSVFVMGNTNHQQPSVDTLSGFWKEKERSFVAIRDHQLNDRPVYFAVKKTLEFHRRWQDGNSTKTDWLMSKYFELHPYNDRPGDFLLMDEIVMCKVFQKDKDGRPSALKDLEIFLEEEEYKGELCPELQDKLNKYMISLSDCLLDVEGASSDEAPPKKRPKRGASSSGKSDVWHRFSKIFNKDGGVLFGVCHSCCTMLKAPVKNGTSSLRRHGEKCSYKSEMPNPVGSSSCSSSSLVLSR